MIGYDLTLSPPLPPFFFPFSIQEGIPSMSCPYFLIPYSFNTGKEAVDHRYQQETWAQNQTPFFFLTYEKTRLISVISTKPSLNTLVFFLKAAIIDSFVLSLTVAGISNILRLLLKYELFWGSSFHLILVVHMKRWYHIENNGSLHGAILDSV